MLDEARALIQGIRGKKQTPESRLQATLKLAELILRESRRVERPYERRIQHQLAKMMDDPIGKLFTTSITDQCFRSKSDYRSADQLIFLLDKLGIPQFVSPFKRMQLHAFKILGKFIPWMMMPLVKWMVRSQIKQVILPEEKDPLTRYLKKQKREGIRVNLNHLGEAILGEEESNRRLGIYTEDLANPNIDYISIKISTIYSQINLLAWDNSLEHLAEKLRQLFRSAGTKFVNLDMEEYKDLHLTVALFRKVLDEPEFFSYSAGIVLQGYIPESYLAQQELTLWAMQRVSHGGSPIKIRIVKGANLSVEKMEASLKGWPQAPYSTKKEVDANFKRMILYGSVPEHAQAVHLGIGSHNIFDISYALLLRAEYDVEPYISFEMLEGMAGSLSRVVHELSGSMLLYCPVAPKDEFQNAIAYLVRRLDENTAPENFLRNLFSLEPGTSDWNKQVDQFTKGYHLIQNVSFYPRRTQNRLAEQPKKGIQETFVNEPDTDWSLSPNRRWVTSLLEKSRNSHDTTLPFASSAQIENQIDKAKRAEVDWKNRSIKERSKILENVANVFRKRRGLFIERMLTNTHKVIPESDSEVSEAIDFIEYYRKSMEDLEKLKDLSFTSKGTILVAPPWNFPCSIPTGCIAGALAAGNCVLFKPAPESVLVGLAIAEAFWEGGISKDVLQFIVCNDEPEGSKLIQDPHINAVILTGGTATARAFLKMRPGLDLIAETGGKNSIIVTALADRDLAVRSIVQSAFGHSGQKCSACSLAILEAEVYDDPNLRKQLKDAAASLRVGSPWNLATKVNPLIHPPNDNLMRALTRLEKGEEWLLKPKQNPYNACLWSPGIKLGVSPGSFTHQTELFGPILGIMRAKNLNHAIELANGTPYGLTAGLQSLDEREHEYWLNKIKAGNCYINREITGAIVQRQPFGGCKGSSFGRGAKAGGPNYLTQLMQIKQDTLPSRKEQDSDLGSIKHHFEKDLLELWKASIGSYAYFWNHYFSKEHDPSKIRGEDNILKYVPYEMMVLRVQKEDSDIDIWRVLAAAKICKTSLIVSVGHPSKTNFPEGTKYIIENDNAFIQRMKDGNMRRVRFLSQPNPFLEKALSELGCSILKDPVLANGRIELLNYLREVCISYAYHRYGNLGERESF
jgi:RHH-type proline utilization regulon transcriptional repressor/proline dehydrogenase/delta 1-pyrroline-5-carboxylate dehydrogenase